MNFLNFKVPKMSGAPLPTAQDTAVILDALRNSPEVAAAVESNETRKRVERQERVKRLATIEADMEKRVVELDGAIDAAMHEVKVAEAKVAEARVVASAE